MAETPTPDTRRYASDLTRAQDAMSKEHQRGKCGACGQSLVAEQRIGEVGIPSLDVAIDHVERSIDGGVPDSEKPVVLRMLREARAALRSTEEQEAEGG